MGISIKNDEVEARIRQLAELRGISLTDAIDQAVIKAIAEEIEQAPAMALDEVMRGLDDLHRKYGMDRLHHKDWHKLNADMFDEHGLPR